MFWSSVFARLDVLRSYSRSVFAACSGLYCVLCLCVESLRDCVSCLLFVVEDVRGYLSSINISIIIIIIMSRAVPAVAKEGAGGICEL